MNNRILCSTGTFVDKINNYDYKLIPPTAKELQADGMELMFLHLWYPNLNEVMGFLSKADVNYITIHFDKQIGCLFSEGSEDSIAEGLKRLEINCWAGKEIGVKKAVLHLWGTPNSDGMFDNILPHLSEIKELGEKYGINILAENIPCLHKDPLIHWREIESSCKEFNYIADTRFLAFHNQFSQIVEEGWFNGKIKHMHVSDYAGYGKDFTKLRPILMPGEGTIGDNYSLLFSAINKIYHDTITLESPAKVNDGKLDINSLNDGMEFIRKGFVG